MTEGEAAGKLKGGGGVEVELALSQLDLRFSIIGFISSFNLPTKSNLGFIKTSRESWDTISDWNMKALLQIKIYWQYVKVFINKTFAE